MRPPARSRPVACPDCHGDPGTGLSGRCRPCTAYRREALHRITKLRPTMDRIGALVAAVKRIAEVAAPADDWRGNSYAGDFITIKREIAVLEKELSGLANEWTLALWED